MERTTENRNEWSEALEREREKERFLIKYSTTYAISLSLSLSSASRRALENCLARNISRKYLRRNWLRERRRMSQFTIACLPSSIFFLAKRNFIFRETIDISFHFRYEEVQVS